MLFKFYVNVYFQLVHTNMYNFQMAFDAVQIGKVYFQLVHTNMYNVSDNYYLVFNYHPCAL